LDEFELRNLSYYEWKKRPAKLMSAETLHLHRRMKVLFEQSRESLGSREMMKKLREESFEIGRYKVRKLMKKLNVIVKHLIAYKVTTKRNERDNAGRQPAESGFQSGWN